MANIYGNYIKANFVRISGKLDRDKTSFFNINEHGVYTRHFIWLRMKNNLQAKFNHHVRGDDVDTTPNLNYDRTIFITYFSEFEILRIDASHHSP